MKQLKKITDIMESIVEWFSVISLSLMVGLVFFNAVLRYVFHTSISVSEELARLTFVWMCLLGCIVAYKHDQHITITAIAEMFPKSVQKVFKIVTKIIVFLALLFLTYGSFLYVKSSSSYMNAGIQINYGLIVSVILIMSVSMVFIDITNFIEFVSKKIKGEKKELTEGGKEEEV